MGSPAVASLIAQAAFWALLVYGVVTEALNVRWVATFVVQWIAGYVAAHYLPFPSAGWLFSPYVAVLDVILVLVVLKGDVRL